MNRSTTAESFFLSVVSVMTEISDGTARMSSPARERCGSKTPSDRLRLPGKHRLGPPGSAMEPEQNLGFLVFPERFVNRFGTGRLLGLFRALATRSGKGCPIEILQTRAG